MTFADFFFMHIGPVLMVTGGAVVCALFVSWILGD